jgi:F-box protein 42
LRAIKRVYFSDKFVYKISSAETEHEYYQSLSLLSDKMAEKQGDNTNCYCYFSNIPIEVTEEILSYLSSYGELQQAKRVCKTWHSLVGRICLQRERYFYDSVCRGKLSFRVIAQKSRITPCQRFSHSSCVVGKSMYIFGGCSTSNTAFNDVYELNLQDFRWSKLRLSGIPPQPKECATMVVHQNRIILFGGWCQPSRLGIVSNAKFYNGVHVLNTETLNWNTPFTAKDWPQPCERAGHAACVVQDQMVMFGGAQRQTRSV